MRTQDTWLTCGRGRGLIRGRRSLPSGVAWHEYLYGKVPLPAATASDLPRCAGRGDRVFNSRSVAELSPRPLVGEAAVSAAGEGLCREASRGAITFTEKSPSRPLPRPTSPAARGEVTAFSTVGPLQRFHLASPGEVAVSAAGEGLCREALAWRDNHDDKRPPRGRCSLRPPPLRGAR